MKRYAGISLWVSVIGFAVLLALAGNVSAHEAGVQGDRPGTVQPRRAGAGGVITVTSFAQYNPPSTNGVCTLGAAILAANVHGSVDGCAAGAGANTIVLPAGLYTLTAIYTNSLGVGYGYNYENALPFINSEITIQGAGAGSTIIERESTAPEFRFLELYNATDHFTLNDVILRGGKLSSSAGGALAAAFSGGALITLNNVVLIDNHASSGGAMGAFNNYGLLVINNSTLARDQALNGNGGAIDWDGQLTLAGSTFYSNTAPNSGGVISLCGGDNHTIANSLFYSNTAATGGVINNVQCYGSAARMQISNSVFHDNTALNGGNGSGGAVRDGGPLTIRDSQFFRNTSDDGGALTGCGGGGSIQIERSAFYSNTAITQNGGALDVGCPVLSISDSAIYSNTTALYGGGLLASSATITNTTIANNSAIQNGGGIDMQGGNGALDLNNVTVAGNNGGGISIEYNAAYTHTLKNSIVAGNWSGTTPYDCTLDQFNGPRHLISEGYNLIGAACADYLSATGDLTGTAINPLDPLLGPLQDNGGSTWTRALITGSVAIDAGNPALPGSGGNACALVDQRGVARPIGLRCDIGAFESGATASNVIAGTVYSGTVNPTNIVAGAYVQACSTTNFCLIASTDATGQYTITRLADSNYILTANPPAGSLLLPGHRGPVSIAGAETLGGQDILLTAPTPPPAGTCITNGVRSCSDSGIPIVYWGNSSQVTTTACLSGTVTYQVLQDGQVIANGTLTEGPPGTYTATIPPFYPHHGNASVVITAICPDGAITQSAFNIYIDPSGIVKNTTGQPLAGATVTLFRSDSPGGPFTLVPNGSAIMSPANQNNPDVTAADGKFGWDVLAGYYKVRAQKAGCFSPANLAQPYVESSVMQIPPPVTNLELTLACNVIYLPVVIR